VEKRDLLITKAEFKDQAGVVLAVSLAQSGPASIAVSSSRAQEFIGQSAYHAAAMVGARAKAKASSKGPAPKQ